MGSFKPPRVIKLALPHVCLWSLAIVYCVAGALVFMQLEGGDRRADAVKEIRRTSHRVTWELYNMTKWTMDETSWKEMGKEKLSGLFSRMYQLHDRLAYSPMDNYTEKWAFSRSLFFTATTLTTIGYGNQTPSTGVGKVFCIFYALFGLPLAVITIADMAKFLSHFIIWLFTKYMMVKWRMENSVRTWLVKRRQRRESLKSQRRQGISSTDPLDLTSLRAGSDEEVAEFLWVNLENAEFVEVPALLMFSLVVGYVAVGGWYFRSIERDWTFFEGMYFSLISILAIGFGDYLPTNERYLYLSLLYVLCGIVLTTTCIDIVGVDYINKLHFWGRQLNKVDPLLWLKEVQARRLRVMKKRAMAALFNTLTALHYMRLDPILLNNMKSLLVDNEKEEDDAPMESMTSVTNRTVEQAQVALAPRTPSQSMENNKIDHTKLPPGPPRNFRAANINVHSVTLAWEPPMSGVTDDMYYSLSYRLRTVCEKTFRRQSRTHRSSVVHGVIASSLAHGLVAFPEFLDITDAVEETTSGDTRSRSSQTRLAPRKMGLMGVEHMSSSFTSFTITGLKSFALYQFSLVAINKNGRSRPIRTQEYTEPSTVPLNVRASSVSDTAATVSWDPPARNKFGPRRYTVHVTSDASKPFGEWRSLEASMGEQQLALPDLEPFTTYVVCVSANHNRGLATLSRSLTVATSATPVDSTDARADISSDYSSPVHADHSTLPENHSSSEGT